MTREPGPIDPFNAALVIGKLTQAIDDLVMVSLRYKPSEKNRLAESIARLAIIRRDQPENAEVGREHDRALDEYQSRYGWLHE